MKDNLKILNNNKNNNIGKNSNINSDIIFIIKKYEDVCDTLDDNEKFCEYCHSKFFSKFNKDRHVKTIHLKLNFTQNFYKQKKTINIERRKDNLKISETKKDKDNKDNTFIGFKRDSSTVLKNIDESYKNIIFNTCDTNLKLNSDNFAEDKIFGLHIPSTKPTIKKNIRDMIVDNFYSILKNNEYYSLGKYFLFRELIIGNGKFGTVFFGIDVKNARPVAIKVSNEEKRNNSFEVEIIIMQKLAKYKLFSKVYDKIVLNKRIYLIETVQGPNLYKLRKFCGGKFSITTIYKIGIEILNCLKLIHKIGYIYLDLKDDNAVILYQPITYKKICNNIILIDYGYCEKYYKEENISPRVHGNIRYSSINALSGNPVSRKDDIISLCYLLADLYLGYLPWENISDEYNKNEETIKMKKIYPFKKLCGNSLKELLFIFNDANSLEFSECPNYDNYIYLMNNYLKNNERKTEKDILFDWERKIIQMIKPFEGIKNLIKQCNEEILDLFEGYPNFFIQKFLEKYINK